MLRRHQLDEITEEMKEEAPGLLAQLHARHGQEKINWFIDGLDDYCSAKLAPILHSIQDLCAGKNHKNFVWACDSLKKCLNYPGNKPEEVLDL
mgnify:FL=1